MGTYVANLARALVEGAGQWPGLELRLLAGPANLAAADPAVAGLPVLGTTVSPESHPRGDLWEHLVLPGRLRAAGVELLHGPAVQVPLRRRGFKTVSTIHDLVPFTHPETVPRKYALYMRALLRFLVRRVDHIIAPSRATRRDLQRVLGVDPARVSVVPEAAGEGFVRQEDPRALERVCRRYGITRPFVLYLGNLEPRKNLVRLVDAFKRAAARLGGGVQLVIGGRQAWLAGRLRAGWRELAVGREVVFPGYIEPEDLPGLMSAATVFAFPSLYEGFGLPVLEALACGAPVLTSHCGSLPEVAGGAALVVDPLDVEQMARALQRLLSDQELRGRLRRAGPARAAEFSWGRAAAETTAVYQRVLGGEATA